jgi:hypothetical protein
MSASEDVKRIICTIMIANKLMIPIADRIAANHPMINPPVSRVRQNKKF